MRFPSRFEFARPWFARFRSACWKLLGLHHIMQSRAVPAGGGEILPMYVDQLHQLTDRLAVMESVLNWRLYGIPARVENIKLEQSKVLAGSGDVERALSFLAELKQVRFPDDILAAIKASLMRGQAIPCLALCGSCQGEQSLLEQSCTTTGSVLVDDPTNLLRQTLRIEERDAGPKVLETDLMGALPLFQQGQWHLIYISDALQRLTPIQQRIVLTRAASALQSGGALIAVICEYDAQSAENYWVDPRRLRPLTLETIKCMVHDLPLELRLCGESGSFKVIELVATGR